MVALRFDVQRGLRELSHGFNRLQREQIPFASAQMLNALAARAAPAEADGVATTLAPVTPFTRRAMAVRRASKRSLVATIFVKDIQAAYLEPYMPGGSGRQVLKAKGILQPVDLRTNQYGNIPRGKIDALRGRPDIFIGPIKTKSGVINGVWQRLGAGGKGVRRRRGRIGDVQLAGSLRRLKLLIRFEDPKAVRPRLSYGQSTAAIITRFAPAEFERAMRQALATAY